MVPSVNPVSLYGAVAGLASVPNVMLSVLWSSLYVSPVIVVHVTSISVSEIAVAVTPVGVVGSQQILPSVNVNYSSTAFVTTFSDIIIEPKLNNFSLSDAPITISVEVTASEHALSGTHKVLLGAYTDDIAVSQFIIVTIV